MSDPDEWQKSEQQRRGGPAGEGQHHRQPTHEHNQEHGLYLTHKQVERIEDDVREEVAATDPAISDS